MNEEELRIKLHSYLDSSGGFLDVLANALHAAGEAGFNIESHGDRRAGIDNGLQRAFEYLEDSGEDSDIDTVVEMVEHSRKATSEFRRGLPRDLENFEIPDHVDSGVYDTLGEFTRYVDQEIRAIEEIANRLDKIE